MRPLSSSEFARCLPVILAAEGGKVDDPRDPGGRTQSGHHQTVFDAYLTRRGRKPRDVYTMTDAERDAIYRAQYWDAIRGDDLPAGISACRVRRGRELDPARAAKRLQTALNVPADGHIGG